MRIILIRHGKPDAPTKNITAHHFHRWIEAYNSATLCKQTLPPIKTIETVRHCDVLNCNAIVCSNLSRSLESAKMLGFNKITLTDTLFREMEMPYWRFPSPTLPPALWAFLFRIFWFLGFTSNAESFRHAKSRATAAAEKLSSLAHQHTSVIFVGHGLLNKYIAQSLISNGWTSSSNPHQGYWDFGIYEHHNA